MCQIGLIDFFKQAGSVNLHEQSTLSDKRYNELKSAQTMIKNYLKGTNLRVDIYDGNSVPADKFVYSKVPDCVFVEVTDLLSDKVYPEEFCDNAKKDSVLRRIFRFIDNVNGCEEPPVEKMKDMTLRRYNNYLRKMKLNKTIHI